MQQKHEKRGLTGEDLADTLAIMRKKREERNAVLLMDLEKMLDAVDRDINGSLPTIAAIELRPLLLEALSLIRSLRENDENLDDEERGAAQETFDRLRQSIVKKYLDWKEESSDALLQAFDGKRGPVSGTVIVPPGWDDLHNSLQ